MAGEVTEIPEALAERIGHQGIERDIFHGSDPGGLVPQRFFTIKFEIDGEVFEKSVDWLLAVEHGAAGDISDIDLEVKLSRISYHAFSFSAAKEELVKKKKELQREYNTWLAQANSTVRQNIITKRLTEKSQGVPASWFGSITKQDIIDEILLHSTLKADYERYQSIFEDLERNIELTKSTYDVILEHGENIRAILFSRNKKLSIQGDYRRTT